MENYQELVEYGDKVGVLVIPEIELHALVTESLGRADLVGQGFYYNHAEIEKWANEIQNWNRGAATKQVGFLENLGLKFDDSDTARDEALERVLQGKESERAWRLCVIAAGNVANFKHIQELTKEYHEQWQQKRQYYSEIYKNPLELNAKILWSLFFSPGKEGYIPAVPRNLDAGKFTETIHNSGGIVLYSPEGMEKPGVRKTLLDLGIDGSLEWHGRHLKLPREFIKNARASRLVISGGSDFDPEKNHWQIGIGSGSMKISHRRLEELLDKIVEIRLANKIPTRATVRDRGEIFFKL